jgi:hypothetical protein
MYLLVSKSGLIDGLHDLAHPRQPASEPLGPRGSAIALRWTDDLGTIDPPPDLLVGVPLAALINDIRPAGRGTHARQARVGMAAQGKERLRQGLILRNWQDQSRSQ